MQPVPAGKRLASWAFDVSVVLTGLVIGTASVVGFLLSGRLDQVWLLAALGGVPLIALMSRFPLVLARGAAGIEVGFDSAVLVFLACIHHGEGALPIWVVGQAVSQLTIRKRPDVRAFNLGISTLSGAGALAAMRAISPLGDSSPRELLAVAVGCTVYFATDYVVSGVSIAVETRGSVRPELANVQGLAAGGVFVAIDSLGYLAALVTRALPAWSSLLLGVPVITILVATRAVSRGAEHQRRLSALFDAAAALQGAHNRAHALDILRGQVRTVVVRAEATAQDEPPGQGQVGAVIDGDGPPMWLVAPARDRARASVDADRQALEALASVAQEALSRLRLSEQMARLAQVDALSGLPNRSMFVDRVEWAVRRFRDGAPPVAVLYLDLDGFKSVNDRFGHAAGDDLLRAVAGRLRARLRDRDCVARLGGDEFAVLVESVEDLARTEQLCMRLIEDLHRVFMVSGHEVVVGASVGVAVSAPGDDAAELLRNADMAMYRAKASGKNQFYRYEPSLRDERIRRLELIEALRNGMDTDLVVHYQPIVDLRTGAFTGVEALVRWQRAGTLLHPDAFIPAAEDSGLVVALGARVLAQVLQDHRAMVEAAGGALELALNVSAHQLHDPGFIEQVRQTVASLGECRLLLELTETVLVRDDAATADALRQLTSAGARLAIDDFGIGFSSIGYLQHLPVALLKIDRSFVRDVATVPRARALVDAILVMAAALDLEVVAEGIEQPEQAELLRATGCASGQGFLFASPQPLDEVLQTLRRGAQPTPDVRAVVVAGDSVPGR